MATFSIWLSRPEMAHGSSVHPTVTDEEAGRYVAHDVELYMPGRWELRSSFAGPVEDDAIVVLQIP